MAKAGKLYTSDPDFDIAAYRRIDTENNVIAGPMQVPARTLLVGTGAVHYTGLNEYHEYILPDSSSCWIADHDIFSVSEVDEDQPPTRRTLRLLPE